MFEVVRNYAALFKRPRLAIILPNITRDQSRSQINERTNLLSPRQQAACVRFDADNKTLVLTNE